MIRRISWLAVLGLALSVAALIIVLSVMKALNQRMQDRTLAAEPHLWVEVIGESKFESLETHPIYGKIQARKEWKSNLQETQDVILRTLDGKFQGAIARGLSEQGLEQVLSQIDEVNLRQGGSISNWRQRDRAETALGTGEVYLGMDLAISLGVFEGDSLMVIPPEGFLLPPGEVPRYERVRVKQIVSANLSDVDAKTLFYIQKKTLKTLSGSASRKVGIEVWTQDPHDTKFEKRELEKMPGVKVTTWQERDSALFFALRMEKLVIGTFLSIASLVAGFSLLSVLGLLISQKRRELGLLQALGLGPQAMHRLLIGIGVCLGGMGLLLGALVGTSISLFLEWVPLRGYLPEIYYDAEIPAQTDVFFVLLIILCGLLLAFLGSWQAGVRLSHQNPSDLLRNQARA